MMIENPGRLQEAKSQTTGRLKMAEPNRRPSDGSTLSEQMFNGLVNSRENLNTGCSIGIFPRRKIYMGLSGFNLSREFTNPLRCWDCGHLGFFCRVSVESASPSRRPRGWGTQKIFLGVRPEDFSFRTCC